MCCLPCRITYTPAKTPWGDYDFRGIWPIENIDNAHILFQRPGSSATATG